MAEDGRPSERGHCLAGLLLLPLLVPLALIRRSRLRTRTVLKRLTPLRSKRTKTKIARATGPDADTVDAVLERDGHSCVVCGQGLVGERGIDWSIHHRKRRSQGGDNSPENLISVDGNGTQGCHGAIHHRPAWARNTGGWMVNGWESAAHVPVLLNNGDRWRYLTAQGGYSTDPPDSMYCNG